MIPHRPTLSPRHQGAYSPDGYGEPGATTIIQRSYDDAVHTPRRLSIDGDDLLEGDDGVWGQYFELDETESAQRVPALIVVPRLSPGRHCADPDDAAVVVRDLITPAREPRLASLRSCYTTTNGRPC